MWSLKATTIAAIHASTPTMTLDALITAYARRPSAKRKFPTASTVMIDTMLIPGAGSMVT